MRRFICLGLMTGLILNACSNNKEPADYRYSLTGRFLNFYINDEPMYYNQSWEDMSLLFLVRKGDNEFKIDSLKTDRYRPMNGSFELYSATDLTDISTKRSIRKIDDVKGSSGESINGHFQITEDIKGHLLDSFEPLSDSDVDSAKIMALLEDYGKSLKHQSSFLEFAKHNIVYTNYFGVIKDIDYVKKNIFEAVKTSEAAEVKLPEHLTLLRGKKLLLISNEKIGDPVYASVVSGKTIFSVIFFYYVKQGGAGKMLMFFDDENP